MMGGDVWEVGKIKIQNSGKNRQSRQIIKFCLIIVPPKIVMLVFSSHFLMVFIGRLPPTKSKMTIEHPQFEDLFPIKHGDFPASHFSFRGVTTQPKQAKHGSLDYGVQSESTTIHPLARQNCSFRPSSSSPSDRNICTVYILYIYIYIV